VGEDVVERYNELLEERVEGEPAAYLIGEWEFYGLPLDINRSVLIPRADTEVIAERAIELAAAVGEGCRVLDLCTGSGCIGLAVAAHVPNARVVLADLSEDALHIARTNTRRNALNRQVVCLKADARKAPQPMLGSFDLIVSNPPYIPSGDIPGLDHSVRDFEPHLALDGGADGLDFYRSITSLWKQALRPGGALLLEVGYDQADAVEQLLAQQGYYDIDTRLDTRNIWRCVEGRI
jgi:release factor glutamine methyltransferase